MKRIVLWDLADRPMLVVEHASGVLYQNQVGGNACWQAELEGVLAPLDLSEDTSRRIAECPYAPSAQGISIAVADALDALLAAEPGARALKVDRARLHESWEAWVYVVVETPTTTVPELQGPYFGPLYGFGAARGVLTWPNSD